jgi:hypothetical protein
LKKGRWAAIVAVAVVLAWIIYSSMDTQAYSCEVCVEFDGQTQCRSAAGATREEAVKTATSVACATLAHGMEQSIRCEQTPPKSINCKER